MWDPLTEYGHPTSMNDQGALRNSSGFATFLIF